MFTRLFNGVRLYARKRKPDMLTFERFKSWLEARPDDEPVGTACNAHSCPVAGWLRTACWQRSEKPDNVTVRSNGAAIVSGWKLHLDDRLQTFIQLVDQFHGREEQVSRDEAIRIIRMIEDGQVLSAR